MSAPAGNSALTEASGFVPPIAASSPPPATPTNAPSSNDEAPPSHEASTSPSSDVASSPTGIALLQRLATLAPLDSPSVQQLELLLQRVLVTKREDIPASLKPHLQEAVAAACGSNTLLYCYKLPGIVVKDDEWRRVLSRQGRQALAGQERNEESALYGLQAIP